MLKKLLPIMQEAGEAILSIKHADLTLTAKANKDVVTQADLLANEVLKKGLLTLLPEAGWLSEESVDDKARLQAEYVWIVDPIDGTRDFARGLPEYAISVALVQHAKPILASIYNPASNELFWAELGGGTWCNGECVTCKATLSEPLSLLASRSEVRRGEWLRFQSHEIKSIGSIAYKMALVAAGKADATWSLGYKHEWDVAAGALLVTEAKGCVMDREGKEILFNQENVKVPGIVATSLKAEELVRHLIKS